MRIIERALNIFRATGSALSPSPVAWRGAASGVYLLGTVAIGLLFALTFLQNFTWQKLPAFVVWISATMLVGCAVLLAAVLIMRLAAVYRLSLALIAPFVLMFVFPGEPPASIVAGIIVILVVSVIGGSIAVILSTGTRTRQRRTAASALALGVVAFAAGLYAIFSEKAPANPALADYTLEDRTLDLPNPGLPGDYAVRSLTYGSGKDRRREEFGENVDLVSRSVDGSKLIEKWDGFSGWLRTSYWGFDAKELPLQARVWYPAGDGPFPLVLIVYGNHAMEDYSDPGYGYLGELFASRGIIFASVDENFVNSSISARINVFADRPGLKEENDARGWLLLQHLRMWRDWNAEPGHPFQNKVDMDRVALIGHSRGGEAVGVAAAFNALDRYPDDATVDFDFGFNLRGVIAIAPVYGQYQPRERPTAIRDVNYFTIHGSMDGDVQSFEGMAQYSRVTFSHGGDHFRAGLYVVGANHGQFNTTWENIDTWLFNAWALDLVRIMNGEAQRKIARVYFGAFLEIVLNDRREYLPMFRDARYAARWLPNTFYINQFSGPGETVIADFEEDIDPATLSMPGGRLTTANLSKWYETGNKLKYDELDTYALVVAWDSKFSDKTARIDLHLPSPADGDTLVASVSAMDIGTLPDDREENENAGDEGDDAEKDKRPLDWSVALTDANGKYAAVPLSYDSALYPLINAVPRRASFLDAAESTEVLFRRFELPLTAFAEASPGFDRHAIRKISFVFDRSEKGAIIIDNVSIALRP